MSDWNPLVRFHRRARSHARNVSTIETLDHRDISAKTPFDPALVEQCQAIMRRHAKSFTRAARFLPARLRDPVAVLYAFCRIADDAVDEAKSPALAQAASDALRHELDHPEEARPIVSAFGTWAASRPLALSAAKELLCGIAGDVGAVRVDSDDDLIRYAYRVAGTVGLLMCEVFGVEDPAALPHAIDLGVAMQLTNICRDVKADATVDRVYLPRTRLERVGVTPEQLVLGEAPPTAIAHVVLDLLAMADHYYASAEHGMSYLPVEARTAILVASRLYQAIGFELRLIGGDALRGRMVVPGPMKAWHVARGLQTAALIATSRAPRPPHDAALHAPLAGLPGVDPRA